MCLRCLAKKPDDRPAARVVAAALAAAVGAQPIIARGAVRSVRASVPAHLAAPRALGPPHRTGPPPAAAAGSAPAPGRAADRNAAACRQPRVGLGAGAHRSRLRPGGGRRRGTGTGGRQPCCKVRYRVRHDWGDAFEARVTVRNAGPEAVTGWRLKFTYPGAQRLARTRGVVQRGRTVLLRRPARRAPGRRPSFGMTLRGSYRDANPLPLTFALDGYPCATEVIGATTDRVPETAEGKPVAAERGAR